MNRLNDQRHLHSIRTAFISTMPIMIIGAYAVVINQLPIPAYQHFMESIFGESWKLFGALAFNATTQILALMVVFLTCLNIANWYNTNYSKQIHGGICGMIGLACYVIVTLPIEGASSLPFSIVGVNGLFVALLVAVIAGESMVRLSSKKSSMQLLSDDPNMAVPQSFASIVPAIIVISGFLLVRILVVSAGINAGFSEIITDVLSKPYQQNGHPIGIGLLYNLSTHLMWLLGIHGNNNVLDGIAQTVFVPAMEANVSAIATGLSPSNLITKTMFDAFVYMGGSGTTLALLITLLIFDKDKSHRILLRYALPNSIFNINEPLIFGIPIVLNPFYAIPFVLTPMLMFLTTTFAMYTGLVPYTVVEVSWATPILISGYIATGSLAGTFLQLINLGLAILVYTPFVRLSEKMAQIRFKQAYKGLLDIVVDNYSPSSGKLIHRLDEVGAVARQISNRLDLAIANDEFYLNYQPIVDVRCHKIYSLEALLRWNHPIHGPINPMVIIALAEETGRIDALEEWILDEAVSQRAKWHEAGLADFSVSVNISTSQLNSTSFHKHVLAILEKYNVPHNQLQLEITESAALIENEATSENLKKLHESGVSIAMDDFGVGHSSLLYLRTQPISTLKIDGSLSRDIVNNPSNLDIIATIYDLCNLLKANTVVEYVDNKAQLDLLLGIGVFLIQGYFYSAPLNPDDIPDFIDSLSNYS